MSGAIVQGCVKWVQFQRGDKVGIIGGCLYMNRSLGEWGGGVGESAMTDQNWILDRDKEPVGIQQDKTGRLG